MKETMRFNIRSKVFAKSDIQNLWNVFLDEYDGMQTSAFLSINVHCYDDTSYERKDTSLFNDGNILDIKKIHRIEMWTYDSRGVAKSISLSLTHGDGIYDNQLQVEGSDSNWVNGVFNRILAILSSVKPQENIFIKHKIVFFNLIALGLGTIIYYIEYLIINNFTKPIPDEKVIDTIRSMRNFLKLHPVYSYIFELLLKWCIGVFPAFLLRRWWLGLWPCVEFDFGPEHMKLEKLRRNRILVFISFVIVPLLINVVYDVIKGFSK